MMKFKSAYTLLELSIVLVILGFTAMTFLGVVDSYVRVNKYQVTFQRLEAIELKILKYFKNNRGLPCPASQTTSSESSGFGEDGDPCNSASTTGVCPNAAEYVDSGSTRGYQGSIPVVSLGMPASYMYDGWGRRFTYYVASNLVCKDGTNLNMYFYQNESYLPVVSNKPSVDGSSQHDYEANAYVVLSHGVNGYGGYTKAGVQVSEVNASSDEVENADGDMNFVYNYFRPKEMDDILLFKTKWQLMLDFGELDYIKRYASYECTCSNTGVSAFDDLCF